MFMNVREAAIVTIGVSKLEYDIKCIIHGGGVNVYSRCFVLDRIQ